MTEVNEETLDQTCSALLFYDSINIMQVINMEEYETHARNHKSNTDLESWDEEISPLMHFTGSGLLPVAF